MTKKDYKIKYTDIADYFIALANETGDSLTNLKLQKLVYYAQAWYLANKKSPLFKEDFQAWVHGPVIPELYRQYKKYGSGPIVEKTKLKEVEARFDSETLTFLQEVAKVYMQYGGFQLEKMTHIEKPWLEARKNIPPDENCEEVVSKDSMLEYYGAKIQLQA